jgi:hypothetical protein
VALAGSALFLPALDAGRAWGEGLRARSQQIVEGLVARAEGLR